MKLTGWYRPDQKPVRVGWYECDTFMGTLLLFWEGNYWMARDGLWLTKTNGQEWKWRGIDRLSQKYSNKSFQ